MENYRPSTSEWKVFKHSMFDYRSLMWNQESNATGNRFISVIGQQVAPNSRGLRNFWMTLDDLNFSDFRWL